MSVKVKLSHLIENLDFQSDEFCSYLNRRTGQVATVSLEELGMAEDGELEDEIGGDDDSLREAIAIIGDEDDNYVKLPDQYEINEYGMMEDFCYEMREPKIHDVLYRAIKGKGAFRRFKDTVHDLNIQDDWYAFREQKLKEFAIEWCEARHIEFIDDVNPKKDDSEKKLKEAQQAEEQVQPGQYRHYKGKEYEVIAVARHSETEEEYVVYRAMYGEGDYWIRPKKMFMEKMIIDGKLIPRFEYLGDISKK